MTPTLILAICFALVALAALAPLKFSVEPESPTGDPYLDHLYGTYHNVEWRKDRVARGSIIDPGPRPYHTGRFTKNRSELPSRLTRLDLDQIPSPENP